MKYQPKLSALKRSGLVMAASALVTGMVAPTFMAFTHVYANGQVTSRSLAMSSSAPSATSVTYQLKFTPTGTTSIGGLVVDFCGDSPVVGNTSCALPVGFNLGTSPAPTISGGITGSGWTASTAQGGAGSGKTQTLAFSGTAAATTVAATTLTFTVAANPSAVGTFYARILTFAASTDVTTYMTAVGTGTTRPASPANMVDYGGVAVSTVNNISVNTLVQESLTFCTVGGSSAPVSCSGQAAPTVNLGTGTNGNVIDSSAVYNNGSGNYQAWMVTSTNAQNGASINMNENWSCNGLSRNSGSTCDLAGNTAASAITAGSGKFGLIVGTSTNGTNGSGSVVAVNNYNSTNNYYYSGAGVTSTYGDPIATTNSTVCNNQVNQLKFGVSAATTTPTGQYSANENLVATGTF